MSGSRLTLGRFLIMSLSEMIHIGDIAELYHLTLPEFPLALNSFTTLAFLVLSFVLFCFCFFGLQIHLKQLIFQLI